MVRRISDFIEEWAYESESTSKVMAGLTDQALSQRVTAQGRTAGTLAWHLVRTIPEMLSRTGLPLADTTAHEAPSSAAAIRAEYDRAAAAARDAVMSTWTDASLEEEREMYGQRWKNGTTLRALISHQAHHRGQLTVLMRQAGLRVPGIYGPAQEDWASMGMKAEA
jgi:uncharacterized damage-inducible protein DinB